jgi:hypothetical protein
MKTTVEVVCAAIVLAFTPSAFADHREEYKAYQAALAAGDSAAAVAHAKKAWQDAELEIHDHKNTAVLAYNYGQEVSATDPAAAAAAFDRALHLTEIGVASLDEKDVRLRAALSHVEADPGAQAARKTLTSALTAYREQGGAASDASSRGWALIASAEMSGGGDAALARAALLADNAVADARSMSPPSTRMLIEALFVAAVARIAGSHRREEDVTAAVVMLDEAISLFPPQVDIATFDRLLARSIAWRAAIDALVKSIGSEPKVTTGARLPGGKDLKDAYQKAIANNTPYVERIQWRDPSPAGCKLDWAKRDPPAFPQSSLANGYIGAALVGYDVVGAEISNAVVLADLHDTGFGEAAIKSIAKWKLAEPVAPECGRHRLSVFQFAISD